VTERVVGGAYRVGELLGRGGMGEVYAAVGPSGEAVAVKFLHPSHANSDEIAARFRREARIAARISSPHVARVLGAGKDRTGELWIAFERLYGESLDVRLRRERRLDLATVAWIFDHVLQGLVAAHGVGIAHRDIKPGNVFIESRVKRARILDFGVSMLREPGVETQHPHLTATDEALGTPAFMAPEQMDMASRVDGRADLYSAGAVAFNALAGVLPFSGETMGALAHFKRYFPPRTLAEVTGEAWPPAIETYLRCMLQTRPEDRFQDAETALQEWRRVRGARS
jgi:serine/threonine protein kinase